MYTARTICTNGREQVVTVESDVRVLHFATILGEENRSRPRSVPYPENVAFF